MEKADEEAFVSSAEIANALSEYCEEHGLLDWSKSKKLHYTMEQFDAAYLHAIVVSSVPYEMHSFIPKAAHDHNEVLSYCRSFADYEISKKRRAQLASDADAIIKAVEAAATAAKKAPAKKASTKKAK